MAVRWLELVFKLPLFQSFFYCIEAESDTAYAGKRAAVRLGRRNVTGFIIAEYEALPPHCSFAEEDIKPVNRIIDSEPLFGMEQCELARWIAHFYICPLGQALSCMLPSGRREAAGISVHLAPYIVTYLGGLPITSTLLTAWLAMLILIVFAVIFSKKLTIDHNKDRGVARNLTFHIKGVPAFYLPYFSFPTTSARQSGFLIPSASSTDSRGLELAIPYYWNIAPDKDATITLRPITKRGIMTQAEYRFLTEKQYGVFAGTWLPNDSKSDYGSRWSASIDHRYQFNDRWHSELLYQRVSDEDYIEDFEDGFTLYDDWYLESYVSVIGNTDFGDVLLRVQDYQKVNSAIGNDDAPYSRLPQLSYSQSWNKNGFNFNLNGEAVRFYKEKTGAAMRLDSELGASYRFTETYGYLEPKLSIQATHYNLDKDFSTITTLNSTTRVLPTFSLDGTLIFEREINWGDSSWTQTIEPRLFYLYTPYKDQSDIPLFDTSESSRSWNWLFARNRFTGRDRIGDANQLTTAVTTRFYNNEDGQEKLRLSLGQIQYFDDRQVSLSGNTIATRSSSVLVGEGAYQIDRHWDVYALAFWDADTHHNERDIVNLRYRLDADRYVNLSHSYSRDSYDQFTLSGGWRINPQWRAFARQDYSALYKQPFNTLLGVEYDDCCWAWRLVGKHYRESPDSKESHNAVYLEFVLKGLGNMGSRSGSILSEEIQGFSPLKEERRF